MPKTKIITIRVPIENYYQFLENSANEKKPISTYIKDVLSSKQIDIPEQKVKSKRHIAKTISYRIISTSVGFLIMWAATGSIQIGTAFGVAELVYKPIQYYIHERIWYKYIKYGIKEK